MATKFSPCKGSYVLNQFPSNVMFGMNGFHVSASGAIQAIMALLLIFELETKKSRFNDDTHLSPAELLLPLSCNRTPPQHIFIHNQML